MKEQTMRDVTGIISPRRTFIKDVAWVLPDCHIGVELEYERAKELRKLLEAGVSRFWDITDDDSLRNGGIELVLCEPLSGLDLSTAIKEIGDILNILLKKGPEFVPEPHYRTSVHVHVDIRDCTVRQYMNIILLGILFEPALYHVAGEKRARNNFSLGSRYSTGYFESLSSAYNTKRSDHVAAHLQQQFKYTAINVTPPFHDGHKGERKGSIEFRHHEGTTDPQRIIRWINILMCLKRAALDATLFSPEWMYKLSRGNILPIMQEVFGSYTEHLVYDNMEIDFLEGARLVQDVIYLNRMPPAKKLAEMDAKLGGVKIV